MGRAEPMSKEKKPIYISKELYEEIRKKVRESQNQFQNVEEYVEFVLKEILKEEPQNVYTPEEEEEIKKRLRSLGYL